jgi:hypothetical protein
MARPAITVSPWGLMRTISKAGRTGAAAACPAGGKGGLLLAVEGPQAEQEGGDKDDHAHQGEQNRPGHGASLAGIRNITKDCAP